MARWLVVAAFVMLVALVPPAGAKGPVQLCGPTGCVELSRDPTGIGWAPGYYPSGSRVPAAAPSPFYVIRFADIPDTLAYWIPSAGALRVGSFDSTRWVPVRGEDLAALTTGAADLEPFGAPRVVRAQVGERAARGGASYLRLFTVGTEVATGRSPAGWLRVWITGSPTPWTDGRNSLWISRRGSLLVRDGQMVRLPKLLAERVRARVALNT
jgi:hypothetical protein